MSKSFDIITLRSLCNDWNDRFEDREFNPSSIFNKLSNLLEVEMNKNPISYNIQYKIYPYVKESLIIDTIWQDKFTYRLLDYYIIDDYWPMRIEDNHNLNIATCRLLLNLSFVRDIKFIMSLNYQFILNLFSLAKNSCVLLQTYAVGLLAIGIENTNDTNHTTKKNKKLIPIIFNRLRNYILFCEDNVINQSTKIFPNQDVKMEIDNIPDNWSSRTRKDLCAICKDSSSPVVITETSSSEWIEIHPLTLSTILFFNIKYLYTTRPRGIFSSDTYEKNYLDLVLKIINSSDKLNVYLTYKAIDYLDVFIHEHQKMAIELIPSHVLQKLFHIQKDNITSTVILKTLSTLSSIKGGIEKICQLPEHTLVELVKYILEMFSNFNRSDKLSVLQFFSRSFHFEVILKIFDNHDGLHKLINEIYIHLSLFESVNQATYTEKDLKAQNTIIFNVILSLKQYFKTHLDIKVCKTLRADEENTGDSSIEVHKESSIPNYTLNNSSQAEVIKKIELLSNAMSENSHWTPVDKLIKLNGVHLFLILINNIDIDVCDMITSALEIINICSVLPKVRLLLCEPLSQIQINYPQTSKNNVGMTILMKIAKLIKFLDPKKVALSIIITCVCAPIRHINTEKGTVACYSANEAFKKQTHMTHNDLDIEKIWDCVKNCNGIQVLIELITTKMHRIEDSYEIHGLACRALAGLARSETIRQSLSRSPLFNSYQLTNLMKNPVLQRKHQEHETFQKNALELLKLIFGKTKHNGADKETFSTNIGGNTKINDKDQQLLDQVTSLQSDDINSSTVSLKSNATDCLTNCHALCEHPVATCPSLTLFVPHMCPEPKPRSLLCTNFAMRYSKNNHSRIQDLKLIFSRFNPTLVFYPDRINDCYLSCEFLSENRIAIGMNGGVVKVINKFTRQEEIRFRTNNFTNIFSVTDLECSTDGKLLIASTDYAPTTSIWEVNNTSANLKYVLNEKYCTFSKECKNKVLGTVNEIATIYDVETCKKIMSLVPRLSNRYYRNHATFGTTDQLVLSDGVLWDTNSGKEIYKFNKLNKHRNGVFHPNRLEIISNTEVWDVRTFGLLHSVPDLNQCRVMFSKTGNGMYSYMLNNYDKNDFFLAGYYDDVKNLETSFKTSDTHDYSNLTMVNVNEPICDMAAEKNDYQIAVVANGIKLGRVCSELKLYDVGVCSKKQQED